MHQRQREKRGGGIGTLGGDVLHLHLLVPHDVEAVEEVVYAVDLHFGVFVQARHGRAAEVLEQLGQQQT